MSPIGFQSHLSGVLCVQLILLLTLRVHVSRAGTYTDATSIFSTLLDKYNYNPQVRPLLDQDQVLYVYVHFDMFSIMEVNDVDQSFKCNGQLGMVWFDEILRWNESAYGGVSMIAPRVEDVFTPRITLHNTIGARDLFGEELYTPITVQSSGLVIWIPGSIFPVSCKLDLTNYPFDEQSCMIDMLIMNFQGKHIQLVSTQDEASMSFYVENEEWDIVNSNATASLVHSGEQSFASFEVHFKLRRKPQFLMMSVLLPIVFLSLLNLLVFAIPVESGEKISFGITVLLALAVFMSIISGMLPRSSGTMPLMVNYIFDLLVLSVLAVVVSIIIVKLHHREKQEKEQIQSDTKISPIPYIRTTSNKETSSPQQSGGAFPGEEPHHQQQHLDPTPATSSTISPTVTSPSSSTATHRAIRCKQLGNHLDTLSLLVFGLVWVSLTLSFLVTVAL